jgi:hypothetical protein
MSQHNASYLPVTALCVALASVVGGCCSSDGPCGRIAAEQQHIDTDIDLDSDGSLVVEVIGVETFVELRREVSSGLPDPSLRVHPEAKALFRVGERLRLTHCWPGGRVTGGTVVVRSLDGKLLYVSTGPGAQATASRCLPPGLAASLVDCDCCPVEDECETRTPTRLELRTPSTRLRLDVGVSTELPFESGLFRVTNYASFRAEQTGSCSGGVGDHVASFELFRHTPR